MSTSKHPPEQRPPASSADAAERLARIVDAAELAAANVIDDAERQARQHLDEAMERANRIAAERLRELADELDPVGREELDPARREELDPARREEQARAHLKPVQDEPESIEERRSQRQSSSAGARLLATQMAVSGADREEIEERLRTGFDIEDASGILDAILGPEE